MRKVFVVRVIMVNLLIVGCSPEISSELHDIKVNLLSGDAPLQGRSLFDALTMEKASSSTFE
ncbi:MAG: hypothetical protein H7249_15855 [Chitinophagaceae bacterium]|nr:hypothetical protein [Oligoflexus sp.]